MSSKFQLFHCLLHPHTTSSRFPLFHYLFFYVTALFIFFDYLFLCFLRHYTISLMFALFHHLFVTSPYYLSFQGFHCFVSCLLRHCSILGFAGPFLCIFTSPRFPLS